MPDATSLTYLDMHATPRVADVDRAALRPEFADLPEHLRRPQHVSTRDDLLDRLRSNDAVLLQSHGWPDHAYLDGAFVFTPDDIDEPVEGLQLLWLLSCGQQKQRAAWQRKFPNALLVTSEHTVYPRTFTKVALAVVAEHHRTGALPTRASLQSILDRYRNRQWDLDADG
ncbi:hypothetical protein [Curtobacterium sp. 20TX0008]|uniref:hypothetical protein n=1 Tax=Curtobacterium sp. 20TX0008 TaxID=3022018 RepID=UPI0023315052|nr:hypothetical protein [Curtobacterium sp. 20TX0008]MDB6425900.1 hypothetical protein [Curtobacterium sp. 20TX0008]